VRREMPECAMPYTYVPTTGPTSLAAMRPRNIGELNIVSFVSYQ